MKTPFYNLPANVQKKKEKRLYASIYSPINPEKGKINDTQN